MTLRFIGKKGLLAALELEFSGGPIWVLGRDPRSADLVLEDPSVSRQHVKVERLPDGTFTIQNMSRSTPTLIDGAECEEPIALKAGAEVQLGDTLFLVALEQPVEAESTPAAELTDELEVAEEGVEELMEELLREDIDHAPEQALSDGLPGAGTLFDPGPAIDDVWEHGSWRFVLKVLSGPNQGAELGLEPGTTYSIGSGSDNDIVLNDLSVSRKHSRLEITDDGISVEDLNSRNGTLVQGRPIEGVEAVEPFALIQLGTSTITVLDREHAGETIVQERLFEVAAELEPSLEAATLRASSWKDEPLSKGTIITAAVGFTLALATMMFMVSLFVTRPVEVMRPDYHAKIEQALSAFPAVQFAYNPVSGSLLLTGHVLTPEELVAMNFALDKLGFIESKSNFVIADSNIWQEANEMMAHTTDWANVTMFAQQPGQFIIEGAVPTAASLQQLQDFLNLNFGYRNALDMRVNITGSIQDQIRNVLTTHGLPAIQVAVTDGVVNLQGEITESQSKHLTELLPQIRTISGVITVTNLTLIGDTATAEGVENISAKYPVNGWVSGPSGRGVVIQGKLLFEGDTLDQMRITAISETEVQLSKNSQQFKIFYNGHQEP